MAFSLFNPCEPCCDVTYCGIPSGVPLCLIVNSSVFPELEGLKIPGVFNEKPETDSFETYNVWSFYSTSRTNAGDEDCGVVNTLLELSCCSVAVGNFPKTRNVNGIFTGVPFTNNITSSGTKKTCTGNATLNYFNSSPFELSGTIPNTMRFTIKEDEEPCNTFHSCCNSDEASLILYDLTLTPVSTLTYNGQFFTNGSIDVVCSGYQGFRWYYNNHFGSGNQRVGGGGVDRCTQYYETNLLIDGSGRLCFDGAECQLLTPIEDSNGILTYFAGPSVAGDEIPTADGPVKRNLFATITSVSGDNCFSELTIPLSFQGVFTKDVYGDCDGATARGLYFGYYGSGEILCPALSNPHPSLSGSVLHFMLFKNGSVSLSQCSGWTYSLQCDYTTFSECPQVYLAQTAGAVGNRNINVASSNPFYFIEQLSIGGVPVLQNNASACFRHDISDTIIEVSE